MNDLFATSLNHQCLLYFLPFRNPNSLGTDALLQNWDDYQVYAFPPWSLIPLVLKKLRSSSGVLRTLIAPFWPQRPWYPELLDLVVDSPVPPPLSRDLLRQPHFHRHHLGISGLSLHACRLSNDCQIAGVLLACSQADRICTSSILTCWEPGQVVGVLELVSFQGSFCFLSYSSESR